MGQKAPHGQGIQSLLATMYSVALSITAVTFPRSQAGIQPQRLPSSNSHHQVMIFTALVCCLVASVRALVVVVRNQRETIHLIAMSSASLGGTHVMPTRTLRSTSLGMFLTKQGAKRP